MNDILVRVIPAGAEPNVSVLASQLLLLAQKCRLWRKQLRSSLYSAWQACLRSNKPPLLAIWGKNDPWFIPPGAEACRRDVPEAQVRFLDTSHLALETHRSDIAEARSDLLETILLTKR